jgi:hypothetical protein
MGILDGLTGPVWDGFIRLGPAHRRSRLGWQMEKVHWLPELSPESRFAPLILKPDTGPASTLQTGYFTSLGLLKVVLKSGFVFF